MTVNNKRFTEFCNFVKAYDFDPGDTAYDPLSTTWLSLEGVDNILGLLVHGAQDTVAGACQLKIQVATDSSGTGATDVVEGTAGTADAVGDVVVVSATGAECIAALPTATHFMVLAKSSTGTDEATGIILTASLRYQEAGQLANNIA